MTREILTQDRLKEMMHYCPTTGVFTRRIDVPSSRYNAGDIAGCVAGRYRHIMIDRASHTASRLAFLYMTGSFPCKFVDHINHNSKDDRWANLREVTLQENCRNRSVQYNNKTGVPGVGWYKKYDKWVARISDSGKRILLGYFDSKSEAIAARKFAETKYGYHPNHGK